MAAGRRAKWRRWAWALIGTLPLAGCSYFSVAGPEAQRKRDYGMGEVFDLAPDGFQFRTDTRSWRSIQRENIVMQKSDYSCGSAALATLRAKPNQLWQTDLFTCMLKRQNRRVYLVAFLDDHSRFVVSFGLHASQSTALVLEVLEAAIANYGPPEEILTDNGAQYVTWRGKTQFTKRLEQRGIRQLVSRPQRPQTLGKIERFWGTLWREFLESAVFADLEEARRRIGHFIDYYNFQRPGRLAD